MVNVVVLFISFLFSVSSLAFVSGNSCKNVVEKLKKKRVVKITYALGYKDARPARFVGDRYEKNRIVFKITQKCEGSESLCEFKVSDNDESLYIKTSLKKKILLRLLNSSVTEDDDENRSHSLQPWKSQRVKTEFLTSLKQADIVFYNGHSRNGGGPDFYPPKVKKDLTVDLESYKSVKDSFKEILNYFKDNKITTSVFGLFSCNSTQHFEMDFLKLNKGVFILTDSSLLYFKDALDKSLQSIEYLLSNDCNKLETLMK